MSDQQPVSGKFVCASCLEDEALQQFAKNCGQEDSLIRECDYCGQSLPISKVVPLDKVIEFMAEAIGAEWCDPVQTSPYCSAEGGYLEPTLETDELFQEIGFDPSNPELADDVSGALGDHEWCRNPSGALSPSQRWEAGWEAFARKIKHERRFTFWYCRDDGNLQDHPDHLPPSRMLYELQAIIQGAKMIKKLPVGTLIWRARCHRSDLMLADAKDFTSPPIESARQPNRMSPAGVSMFYGAAEIETAVTEVQEHGKAVSAAQFTNCRPLDILDLTTFPELPSYFAPDGPMTRHAIRFLNDFATELAKPITQEGSLHIEYVPTQVFTEFVRHLMKGPRGTSIDGMKYRSSKKPGGNCYVIFADSKNCLPSCSIDDGSQVLRFVDGSIRSKFMESSASTSRS